MNAPVDTLSFAQRLEGAGFDHNQAQVIAAALGDVYEAGRSEVVTKDMLRSEFAEFKLDLSNQLSALKLELVREIGTVGKDVNGRLWSTVTIVAGVATAISATVAAATALLLKTGGL